MSSLNSCFPKSPSLLEVSLLLSLSPPPPALESPSVLPSVGFFSACLENGYEYCHLEDIRGNNLGGWCVPDVNCSIIGDQDENAVVGELKLLSDIYDAWNSILDSRDDVFVNCVTARDDRLDLYSDNNLLLLIL